MENLNQNEQSEKNVSSSPETPPASKSAASRSRWWRFFEILLGILLAMIAAEGLLRITDRSGNSIFYNDEKTGLLMHTPHSTYTVSTECYEHRAVMNNVGFYAKDISVEKKSGTYRIAIIGSSFTESLSIPLSQHFATLLAEKLNAHAPAGRTYEVTPFGFSGNGTYLNMLYYKNYVTQFHPDLVIDLTTDHELNEDGPNSANPPHFDSEGRIILDLPREQSGPLTVFAKNALRKSKLIASIYGRYMILRANMHPKVDPGTSVASSTDQGAASMSEALWKTQEALLSQFQDLARTNGSRFLLVSWSRAFDNLPVPFTTHIAHIANAHAIPYLDLDPLIAERKTRENVSPIWSCEGHWNATGEAWTADAIYDELEANSDLLEGIQLK